MKYFIPTIQFLHKNAVLFRSWIVFFLLIFITYSQVQAQISAGGKPQSFGYKSLPVTFDAREISAPDLKNAFAEDETSAKNGMPYRFAINLPADFSIQNSGTWEKLPDGGRLWRLKIVSPDAKALTLYFDRFRLPEGGKLFLYDESQSQIIGAFTSANNSANGNFATELIAGESTIMEYNEPAGTNQLPDIHISEIAYAYRGVSSIFPEKNASSSGICEVNINCTEGENWQNQKQGVVRIMIKKNGAGYWCTGSLLNINNTLMDATPYLLTADHCGMQATPDDVNRWIFYFNYEGTDCQSTSSAYSNTMTGAVKKAEGGGGGETGSDFYLVLLNQNVPGSYNPFFNGWNARDEQSSSGVCIHHPAGDIKKISTYTSPVVSSDWNNNGKNSHWEVLWAATANGHGVTEGGSSGSPLYNANGQIIGTLTGGDSDCDHLTAYDYFGKFSYSWNKNGTSSAEQLKPWLDPDNSGITSLNGLGDPNAINADFSIYPDTIPINGLVNVSNTSSGIIKSYRWTFEGGLPSSSTDSLPSNIQFNSFGFHKITLSINNDSDTSSKTDSVWVSPVIYPNPSAGQFNVILGQLPTDTSVPEFQVYNILGQPVSFRYTDITFGKQIYLTNNRNGLYFLKIKFRNNTSYHKMLRIK